MAKRFTDTDKWQDPWFRKLPSAYQKLWLYILDMCDHAAVWKVDIELASFMTNEPSITIPEALAQFKGRVIPFKDDKWFIPKFIEFQYGVLDENCRPHRFVLKLLKYHHLEGYLKGTDTLKDQNKDQDQDKDQDNGVQGDEKADTCLAFFDLFWAAYPTRDGKKIEKAESLKAFRKISVKEHNLVVTATRNYANSGRLPKDPKRFLKDNFWREWIDPATPHETSAAPKTALSSDSVGGQYLTKAQAHNLEALRRFNEKHANGNTDKSGPDPIDMLSGPEV